MFDWPDYQVLGNPLREWAVSVAVALAALFPVRRLLRLRLQKMADTHDAIFF